MVSDIQHHFILVLRINILLIHHSALFVWFFLSTKCGGSQNTIKTFPEMCHTRFSFELSFIECYSNTFSVKYIELSSKYQD